MVIDIGEAGSTALATNPEVVVECGRCALLQETGCCGLCGHQPGSAGFRGAPGGGSSKGLVAHLPTCPLVVVGKWDCRGNNVKVVNN